MVTTYGDITPRTAGAIATKLLARGQFEVILERFGQYDPQPRGKTKVRKFRRYNSVARATAPLADGITPAGQKLTYTDVNATLEEYGDWFEITDQIVDFHEDPVLDEAVNICGEQIAETVEVIRFSVLKGGSNVFYANKVAGRSTVAGPATKADFRRIYRSMMKNKAKQISSIIKASASIATEPVAPAFFALCHTDNVADITNLSGFTPVEKYSDSTKALPMEFGKLEQFRFLASPLFEPWLAAGASGTTMLSGGVAPGSSLAADVYPILVVAKDAYGIVPLQGKDAVTPMVVQPKPVQGDPLGQRGFVSWKTYQTSVILNQNWLARLEVAASADPTV
jgi:N4-gp56 family major capsid protein